MLVDTSVWIDYFNGHASFQANRLERAIAEGEPIALPGLVWTEILLGLPTETEAKRIANCLTHLTISMSRHDWITWKQQEFIGLAVAKATPFDH